MLGSIRHFKGNGVAVIAVAIAFLLTQSIWWLIQPHLYPLFLAAVMVSSWYGSMGPGLFAIALSTVLCAYFFVPPFYSLAVERDGIDGLLQFVLVALLISYLNTRLRSTQEIAERNAREAQQNYEFLRQSQESLRRSEERYRILVEGVTEYAIFMLDPNGIFASWNVGSERMLGYSEAEIIGQPFARIFTSEAIQQGLPAQVLENAIAEGFSRENRWHIRKDGTYIWTHCIITVLRDENGNLRGFAKIMQDITQRKLAEEEREELLLREQAARAEAEAANRAKDDFLAVVSHELRTPMTAIVGWAGMLQTGMLDEGRAALAMETIERNATLQMQLIEDLLDISRIVRGDISLNFDRVDLARVITAAIEVVQPAANEKAIDLEFVGESGKRAEVAQASCLQEAEGAEGENNTHHAPLVWGDAERLQQVVWNLLSNAIKFTPEGGRVEVRLTQGIGEQRSRGAEEQRRLESTPDSRLPIPDSLSYAQIQVTDTGIGIERDFLPYVFDRFRQADSTSVRSNKGLGLGLAIARHLVELHGGTIRVDSPGRGQGTTFTIELPILERTSGAGEAIELPILERTSGAGEAGEENPLAPSPQPPAPSLEGLRVLVVDDEADTRQWIAIVLEESGAEVIAVGSVEEALEAIEQHRPDVLVSDIGMPGVDGYALIRKIRELEPQMGGTIPAVALTGYAREEDYTKALAEGFQLHVAKPIRAAELVAVVTSLAKMAGKL